MSPRSGRLRWILFALDGFVAVTALGGGLALAAGLEGDRFPPSWLAGTPFADYVAPGLILAVVVGGSAALAAIALLRGIPDAPRVSLVAGLILAGWIIGEIALLRADDEIASPTEMVYLAIGVVSVVLATVLERSRRRTAVA